MHGTSRGRRHRLGAQDHQAAGAARRGAVDPEVVRRREQAGARLHAEEHARRPPAPRARCAAGSTVGARSVGCAGASARKRASRSRPSCFMTVRSWVGLATPRAAANASPISSGVKNCSARSYTRSASVRTASTSIMLARSTAWRHGDGRTCANATSMSDEVPVAHEQVRGLDVAVREPRVPELADRARGPRR